MNINSSDLEKQDFLNFYATNLRNTADQDYISARMSYRANLIEPFLWSSLHAVEKYLKAILLFTGRTTFNDNGRSYSHNICDLLNAVEDFDEIDLRLTERARLFIKYLNEYGPNRYFDKQAHLQEYALDELDETVWYIRRQCYVKIGWGNISRRDPIISEENPRKYGRLPSPGFLEKVLDEQSFAYEHLTWDNWFYGEGEVDRENIRKKQYKFSVINSALPYYGKMAFDVLNDYVSFSAETKKYFKVIKLID
ncbi:MAG: HEPN domain-containing protein [Candidatus Methylumidiphilus sp.]